MSTNRKILFATIAFFFILASLIFLYFFNPGSLQRSTIFRKFLHQQKSFEIVDEVYKQQYQFNSNIHNDPEVVEFIRGSDIDRFDKKVIITSDSNKKGASILENGNILSGYGHDIDYENELVYLYIFVDPQFLKEEEIIYHLNLGYLGALFTAVEKNKLDKNPNYIPDYNSASQLAHEVNIKNADIESYFLTK